MLSSSSIRCLETINKSRGKLSGAKFLKHLLITIFGLDLGIPIFLLVYTRQWSLIPISETPISEKRKGLTEKGYPRRVIRKGYPRSTIAKGYSLKINQR